MSILSEIQSPNGIDPRDDKVTEFLKGLQGNILQFHGRDFGAHVFLSFTAAEPARQWIASLANDPTQGFATSAAKQYKDSQAHHHKGEDGEPFGAILLSASGYEFLGFPTDHFESHFRHGMRSKKRTIMEAFGTLLNVKNQDPDPEFWQQDFAQDIHMLLILAEDLKESLNERVEAVKRASLEFSNVFVEFGHRLYTLPPNEKDREHFGYRDGISQPVFIAKDVEDNKSGLNDPTAPLELVLARDPFGGGEAYGSYLVFRKLEQDVEGFANAVSQLSQQVNNGDSEMTGAQVVGRFKDGTPVSIFKSPQGNLNPQVQNAFDYHDDAAGLRCPAHAHIRKANPRGTTPLTSLASERSRRIARRGMPYGEEGENKVGLLFMCYQSDINHQFIFMQRTWIDNPNFPHSLVLPKTGVDALIGQNPDDRDQEWPVKYGQEGVQSANFSGFVQLKGGEYFFAPSLKFLQQFITQSPH